MKTTTLCVLASLAVFSADISAQCFAPDNLSGPCWTPTVAKLPSFPGITMPGMNICWDQCNPTTQTCADVNIGVPFRVGCDQFNAKITVRDCVVGAPLLEGDLILDYTRTWDELDPTTFSTIYQVWRFAAKIDMRSSTTSPLGCPVPSCIGPQPSAFYYGYMDYALDCASGQFKSALVLHHGCDEFQHDTLFSDRPGTYHPGTSYALVAPASSANPFVAGPIPATGGPILAEAMRISASSGTSTCIYEEPIAQGVIQPIGMACFCPFAFIPVLTARHMEGVGICSSATSGPSSFKSINLFPVLPWYEVMTTSIGSWTSGASYPGPEQAWVDEGLFLYNDGYAASLGLPSAYADIMYGGSTSRGFPVRGHAQDLTDRFTDLASNWAHQLGTPVALPILGSVRKTDHLVYVNNF